MSIYQGWQRTVFTEQKQMFKYTEQALSASEQLFGYLVITRYPNKRSHVPNTEHRTRTLNPPNTVHCQPCSIRKACVNLVCEECVCACELFDFGLQIGNLRTPPGCVCVDCSLWCCIDTLGCVCRPGCVCIVSVVAVHVMWQVAGAIQVLIPRNYPVPRTRYLVPGTWLPGIGYPLNHIKLH
jgi:hypothetical protein